MRLVGGIRRGETARGAVTGAFRLHVDRGLKSGKLDVVELSEDQLFVLLRDAANAIQQLREAKSDDRL